MQEKPKWQTEQWKRNHAEEILRLGLGRTAKEIKRNIAALVKLRSFVSRGRLSKSQVAKLVQAYPELQGIGLDGIAEKGLEIIDAAISALEKRKLTKRPTKKALRPMGKSGDEMVANARRVVAER